jgi:hypothetical protein
MNAARAACQNRLCANAVRHHSRQRATVRRDTPKSCDNCATRGGVAPCSMAEINTTIVARYTRPRRNRSDAGVLRCRHPSTAQQKLDRRQYACLSRPAGRPLALR